MENGEAADADLRSLSIAIALSLIAAVAFYFSVRSTQQPFDYTLRIASALLHGHLGLRSPPPSWLNEMVPRDGNYYSVFPLGAVLSLIPVALLHESGLVGSFPGRTLAALIVGLCVYFFFQLSTRESRPLARRILLALFPIFGTWTWCNLGFGGAWHIALGFALLGEVAALCFTIIRPRPLIAGASFALAFGNRTELLLTLPIYIYLSINPSCAVIRRKELTREFRERLPALLRFLLIPAILGFLTAAYNFARFHSIFDFGYSHIPNVLEEPWYQQGLFSFHAIPWNMHKMLFEGFGNSPHFPYIMPYPFGCSIFLSSPFLVLLFREGGKHKLVCWLAIVLLTFALWCHGNPGGWEFSYRYAMILLPWFFLLLLENGPGSFSTIELILFAVSVAINAIATYLFLWTDQIHP
jgi:nitrogen fixation-related uncharacterized protein